MQINENLRNFPIKFYKNTDDTVYYESAFVTGTAKTLNDAFKQLQKYDWEHDLIYYFADVDHHHTCRGLSTFLCEMRRDSLP